MSEKISLYIVEDYELSRITYLKYFESQACFEVLGAFETAEECLEAMKNRAADILIIDIELPGMDGITAIKHIKENYPQSKCIILTTRSSEECVLSGFSTGAKGYLLKDSPLDEVSKSIKLVYNGAYWLDSQVKNIVLSQIVKASESQANAKKENIFKLTSREFEVLNLLCEGKSNPEIAEKLFISINTAKAHVGNIIMKLDVNGRGQAIYKAIKHNLVN